MPRTDIIHTLTLRPCVTPWHCSLIYAETVSLCHTHHCSLIYHVHICYTVMFPLCHTHHCSLIYHVHICYTGLFPYVTRIIVHICYTVMFPLCHTLALLPYVMFTYVTH